MTPIAVETYGSLGQKGEKVIDEIGNMMIEKSGEKRSKFHLYQRISMAIQRGNVASVLGTVGQQDKLGNRHPHVEALGVHAGEGPSNTTITILYLQVMKPFNLEF